MTIWKKGNILTSANYDITLMLLKHERCFPPCPQMKEMECPGKYWRVLILNYNEDPEALFTINKYCLDIKSYRHNWKMRVDNGKDKL